MTNIIRSVTCTVCVFALFAAGTLSAGGAAKLAATPGVSSLTYKIVHPMHEFESVSHDVTCTITVDDSSGTIRTAFFSADVTSFDSGNSNRDSHAMEVVDALTYPTVSFKSTNIRTLGTGLSVDGDLEFHGQTHPVSFSAATSATGDTLAVAGSTSISMTAFGIDRPSLLLVPVQDTIRISFQMKFPKGTH
ncbi:MAG TPA: YceI family protein [Bacteroidota bacterium]|nr:YceI family protein [Bacteroidota bacterium]